MLSWNMLSPPGTVTFHMGDSSRAVSKRNLLAGVGLGLLGGLTGYGTTIGRAMEAPEAMRRETDAEMAKRTSGEPTFPPMPHLPFVTIDLTCTDLTVTVEPRATSFYLRTRHRDDETAYAFNRVHGPYEGTVTDSFENLHQIIIDVEVFWRGTILAWKVRPSRCDREPTANPGTLTGPIEVGPGTLPRLRPPGPAVSWPSGRIGLENPTRMKYIEG
ncbi:hypothetical protein [Haloarchaeobius sp. TZWSO28]|uniref:hypothetical protein n=1 Tax=Haloarchaeobius sp. TZWSO28 TaxID=3446119 RepID=UPI003EBC81BE